MVYIKKTTLFLFLFLLFVSCKSEKNEPNTPLIEGELQGTGQYVEQIPAYFEKLMPLKEGNSMTYEGIRLGRRLFYEKKLSGDNSMSCGTCHQQKKGFTDGQRFSTGIEGLKTPVTSMAIVNMAVQSKFLWNGKFSHLEDQALAPITNPIEMNQSLEKAVEKLKADEQYPPLFRAAFGSPDITPEKIGFAVAQFVRTIISKDSKFDRYLRGDEQLSESEMRGMELFRTHPIPGAGLRGGNCGDCHLGNTLAGSTFDFRGFHNNGLDTDANLSDGLSVITGEANDKGKFKAVSLRNIALTAPYMHDGRFNTLEEVLEHYDLHVRTSKTLDPLVMEASNELTKDPAFPHRLYLTAQEKKDIIAFLHTLSDETFINNPLYGDIFNP